MSTNLWIKLAIGVAAMGVFAGTAVGAPPTICTTTMSGAIAGDIVVPSGGACALDDADVSGNVNVLPGGSLYIGAIAANTRIRGSVKARGCEFVFVSFDNGHAVVIDGDFHISSCTGKYSLLTLGDDSVPSAVRIGGSFKCINNSSWCTLYSSVIDGDFACSGNTNYCEVYNNAIGGNATLNNNQGGIYVDDNAIGGDLKCHGNWSASGSGNVVAGIKSGQCSDF